MPISVDWPKTNLYRNDIIINKSTQKIQKFSKFDQNYKILVKVGLRTPVNRIWAAINAIIHHFWLDLG